MNFGSCLTALAIDSPKTSPDHPTDWIPGNPARPARPGGPSGPAQREPTGPLEVLNTTAPSEHLDLWQPIGLVLAAGAGRRYGGPKAPVLVDGERLVDRAVRVLRQGGCPRVLVVLGAWLGAVASAEVVLNPAWESGMGSSLRAGLTHLLAEAGTGGAPVTPRRAVITLVDLPGLTPEAVAHLWAQPEALLAARYRGQQGHPVLIGEAHWPALINELDGDHGARHYLQRQGVHLIDLDHLANGDDLDQAL